jgi:hypothetical protein
MTEHNSTNIDYDKIAEEIICNLIERYETEPLNSKQRSMVHEIIKKYDSIESISLNISGSPLKKIVIKKKDTSQEKNKLIIDSSSIRFFCDYMKIPFPVMSEKYVEYYLNLLDKYYDCKNKWKIFLTELENKSLHSIKNEVIDVNNRVIEYIKSHEEYKEFITKEHSIPDIAVGNEIYSTTNSNKLFVSIDIVSANYRVLKTHCPSLCENLEWSDFIRKFTNNEFIIKSKYAREVIFGKLGCKSINKMPIIFIDNVIKHIDEKYGEFLRKIRCSNDEVIFEISPEKINLFLPLVNQFKMYINEIDDKCYRVEVFRLAQLGNHAYFVKQIMSNDQDEFSDVTKDITKNMTKNMTKNVTKDVFKGVPKKFSAQCVKFYENQPILEIDRKFTDDNNLIATYDQSIFEAEYFS